MSELPNTLPSAITAGTTVKVRMAPSDYPASGGWVLKLFLAGPSVTDAVVGVADGAAFVLTLSAADTGRLLPGGYQWRALAEKAGEVYVAASGTVTVSANIASAGAGDLQTWEARTLAVVEAALEGRLASDMEAYQIAGRAVTKIPASELMALRDKLKSAVLAQRNPGKWGRDVLVTFPPVRSS